MEKSPPPPYNQNQLYFGVEKPINWRKYIYIFLSNWHWFLITIFIAISVAYIKNRYTLPTYKATATLIIEEEEGTSDLLNAIRSVRRQRRTADLANETAKLNAFSLHRRTIDSLGWDIFWTAHGRVAMERPLYNNPPFYIEIDTASKPWHLNHTFYIDQQNDHALRFYSINGIDTLVQPDTWYEIAGRKIRICMSETPISYASYSFIIYDRNRLTTSFRSKLTYEADEKSGTVITISSVGPIAEREIDYINTLCENYIYSGLERKRLIAENTLEFVEYLIHDVQDSLQSTEQQILAFRLGKNIVDLSREGQMAYEKLKKFYDLKTQLKLKRNYYDYLKEYIENKRDPQAIISPTLVDATDLLLIEYVFGLQILYEDREQLAFSAEKDNPGLVHINARIQTARNKILEILDGLIHNNDLAWKQMDTEENQIEQHLLQLPASEQELINIQRKYEVNNQFYTFLLEKRAEAGIQIASTVSNVRILDQANIYNVKPVGTKKSVIYLSALIFGLIVPGVIIFLADALDNRIKDQSDIEENTDLPILGVISHYFMEEVIPVHVRPGDVIAESFRHIRTNLQYILHEPDQKVIMITSAISGEGKTFIALNLAAILAMANNKVLLIGLDLRRPSLHKIFNLDNSKGISTFLARKNKFEDIISPTNIENLDTMIAGPVPPNSAELLGTKRLSELINKAYQLYDYIVIDTPPVALVTDALLISKHSHANIFIIRQNFSPKDTLEIINRLKDKHLRNTTLLINDIKESKIFGYRYYYGYGLGYGYHYRYGYEYYKDTAKKNI